MPKIFEAPPGFVLHPDYLVPELRAQRDALLEVLIRCRDRFFPANQPERDRDELWEPVNAAIKAVEGWA